MALYVAAGDSLVRVYAFPIVLQMGSLGLLIIGRRLLPTWTGWAALGLAAAMVVAAFAGGIDPGLDFGFPVYIGILVWTAVVSVILLVRAAARRRRTCPSEPHPPRDEVVLSRRMHRAGVP